MTEIVHTIQHWLMVASLVTLACLGISWLAVAVFPCVWEAIRKVASLGTIQGCLVAFIVGAFVQYGATKGYQQKVTFDEGLTNNGSLITNSTVRIAWTYSGIPSESTVYIDYRTYNSTNAWDSLAETVASALGWSGIVQNATNYEYYVYSTYIPPAPVHTNGVWVGNAYKSQGEKRGFVVTNSRITDNGKVIATPEQVKRSQEEQEQ